MVVKLFTIQQEQRPRLVSVPLRGNGRETISFGDFVELFPKLFPSPCGEMVVKPFITWCLDAGMSMFPSPCGEMVVKH